MKSSSFSGLQDAICLYSILSTDGKFESVASSTMSYSLDHSTSDETSVVHQSLKADGRKKPRLHTRWPIFRQRVMPRLCSILNSFNPHEKRKDCVRLLWASKLPCLALVQWFVACQYFLHRICYPSLCFLIILLVNQLVALSFKCFTSSSFGTS